MAPAMIDCSFLWERRCCIYSAQKKFLLGIVFVFFKYMYLQCGWTAVAYQLLHIKKKKWCLTLLIRFIFQPWAWVLGRKRSERPTWNQNEKTKILRRKRKELLLLIPWAVSKRWYSEWSHSIRHFAQISNKLFRLKKPMSNQGEVEMHSRVTCWRILKL